MYNKGKWQDRIRHRISVPKQDRLVHHIAWKLDDKGRREVRPSSKVTRTYQVQVSANDVYRMLVENDGRKAKYGHELWHRGARVGQI